MEVMSVDTQGTVRNILPLPETSFDASAKTTPVVKSLCRVILFAFPWPIAAAGMTGTSALVGGGASGVESRGLAASG